MKGFIDMKILRGLIYFTYCILLLCLISCHLDKNKKSSNPERSSKPKPEASQQPLQALVWSGALEVTNGSKYRDLLRDYRKCDPCTHYFGPLDCKNFDSGGDVEIQFNKNADLPAKATLRITPRFSGQNDLPFYGYLGVCGFSVSPREPIELTGTAKYWNDYQGFHVKFTGSTGGGGGLAYVILRSEFSNPIENGLLDVNIYYGGSANQSFVFGRAELENSDLENLYPSRPAVVNKVLLEQRKNKSWNRLTNLS